MRFLLAICVLVLTSSLAAHGAPVDPGAPDGVASRLFDGQVTWALDTNGQTWCHEVLQAEWRLMAVDLPVPLSQISEWYAYYLITMDSVIWAASGLNEQPGATAWYVVSPVPSGTVPSESSGLGDLKSQFR